MRDFRRWTLALAVLVAWCAPARAAEEKKKAVPEDGAVQVILLRHKAVREDLKLTDDETKKIHEFTNAQWKKAVRLEEMSPEERDKGYAELTKENERFLDEVLESAQRKRLNQITLHVAGLLWLTKPHVASELKLTDEQKEKARKYQQEARAELEDLLHSATTADRHAKLKELRETSKKRIFDLLTPEQEVTWHELMGPPFKGELRFDEVAPD